MKHFYRSIFFWVGLTMVVLSGHGTTLAANETARPEVRAFWVDAFHDGAKNPQQIDKLVKDCVAANINTLYVQVRRRGDAYYNKSFEPRTEDPKLPAEFDALQYLIDKAHANRVEVHAWLNTLVAWKEAIPPKASNHVWNLHGPQATGRDNWIAYYRKYNETEKSWSKELYSSFFLDPGHPDVVDYTANVYLNVVKNYDVDGIHLDYSRYDGTAWGYNATNVARYNDRYQTTGLPEPEDPRWLQWRREQTANLVRKIYLKAIALKPGIKVTSAVITWGDGPLAEGDWEKSKPYLWVCQDWRRWLEEGIIDQVIPMNYFAQWKPVQKERYKQWVEWEKDHAYNRQIVVGPGLFSQYFEQSLEQIRMAQAPSAAGNYASGVALYAYGWNNIYSNTDYAVYSPNDDPKELPRQPYVFVPKSNDWMTPLLAKAGSYKEPVLKKKIATKPVFPKPVAVPEMPWKTRPVKGFLMGTVADLPGKTCDGVKVVVEAVNPDLKVKREAVTDGSGWYGLAELPPGQYRVSFEKTDFSGIKQQEVLIQPGVVREANFNAVPAPTPVTAQPGQSPQPEPAATPEKPVK